MLLFPVITWNEMSLSLSLSPATVVSPVVISSTAEEQLHALHVAVPQENKNAPLAISIL